MKNFPAVRTNFPNSLPGWALYTQESFHESAFHKEKRHHIIKNSLEKRRTKTHQPQSPNNRLQTQHGQHPNTELPPGSFYWGVLTIRELLLVEHLTVHSANCCKYSQNQGGTSHSEHNFVFCISHTHKKKPGGTTAARQLGSLWTAEITKHECSENPLHFGLSG